jgi:hypothetical protein
MLGFTEPAPIAARHSSGVTIKVRSGSSTTALDYTAPVAAMPQ